jgi:hypothetical protein
VYDAGVEQRRRGGAVGEGELQSRGPAAGQVPVQQVVRLIEPASRLHDALGIVAALRPQPVA